MSTELIRRINIRKDGVYILTKSNNDSHPYHNVHIDAFTQAYREKGQKELDILVLKMICDYGQLVGQDPSIMRYRKALQLPQRNDWWKKHIHYTNALYSKLPQEDKDNRWLSPSKHSPALRNYLDERKKSEYAYYEKIADVMQRQDEKAKKETER